MPHPHYLEVGCAVITLAPGAVLDAEHLDAHCRAHLAAYKCPRHYVTVGELPRNASGKILKHRLRDRFRAVGEELLPEPAEKELAEKEATR